MRKNKIAILTQPLGHNYGGIVQNYALQKVLKDLGHNPITIDRRGGKNIPKIRLIASRIKWQVYKSLFNKNVLTAKDQKRISLHTRNFLKKKIQLSPTIKTTTDLKSFFHQENFSAVIVGSDQTWRPKYSPDIFNFYLDFLSGNKNIQKLAYASSFGTEEWEYSAEETEKCKQLIQEFDAISVREKSGVDLCKNKLNAEAVHLLDPTLLLNAEDYRQLINKPQQSKGLFTYVLDDAPEKLAFIQNAAKKLNLNQTTNQPKHKFKPEIKRAIYDYVMPPLEGWLQGFRDAEFVITDSFHGTVFSIINRKPFISIVNKERGASRFESLLGQLGLSDRMVYDVNLFDENKLTEPIDFDTVHVKLHKLKEESFNFLKESL